MSIFLLRRLITAFVLVFFLESPIFQTLCQMLMSLLYLIYLFLVKPYEEPFENKLEIFNEIMYVMLTYSLLMFSDLHYNYDIKFNIGWGFIMLFMFQLSVNVLLIVYSTLKGFYMCLKSCMIKLHRYCFKPTVNTTMVETNLN